MSILYTLISNKPDSIICEYNENYGNFLQLSRIILAKEIEPETQRILLYNNHKFCYINENGITFLCLSKDMEDKTMISFLIDVKNALYKTYDYNTILTAHAYQMGSFTNTIKDLAKHYQDLPRYSVSGELINELKEAKNLITKNISDLIDRDQKLELTVNNASLLKDSAVHVSGYVRFKKHIKHNFI